MALKGIEAIHHRESSNETVESNSMTLAMANREDFSFFNPHLYANDTKGNYVMQKRFHFISENRYEIIYYVGNILIRCLHVSLIFILNMKE